MIGPCKQIYLQPNQARLSKEIVHETSVSEAELNRKATDVPLAAGVTPKRNSGAWEHEREYIGTLMKKPVAKTNTRTWKWEDLYDR